MKRVLLAGFTAIVVLFLGCSKPKPDPGTGGTGGSTDGKYTFWIQSDLGVGSISVVVDGVSAGTITQYHSNGVTCGSGNVNVTKPAGTYTWSATATNKSWSGTITFTGGQCKTMQLTSSGSTGGGGGGTGGGGGGGSTPTVTTPNTMLISWRQSMSQNGVKTEQFTVAATSTYVFRFASQYAAKAAIIPSSQYNNFVNGSSYTYNYLYNGTFGTQYVTLNAGTYYVAYRNTTAGTNEMSIELDKDITLPSSDKAAFQQMGIQGNNVLTTNQKIWHQFTIQSGYRYFLDGCNVNTKVYIIPSNQLTAFQNNQTFNYYTDYDGSGHDAPGLWEIKLQAGTYYMVGKADAAAAITYNMEIWKVTP